MNKLFLGIDLGTTNSKAAFLDYRLSSEIVKPEILDIKQQTDETIVDGSKKSIKDPLPFLPSVVLFNEDGRHVTIGKFAQRIAINFPDRSVRAIKRLMGKNWRYAVNGWDTLTPQGISGLILRMIRKQAQEFLHDTLNDLDSVTISVPASFGGRQREATKQAARLAGFKKDIFLIDEPSAALIHYLHNDYGFNRVFEHEQQILVFDLGGGTLDVSLAHAIFGEDHLKVSILSRSRYTELAGTEFDTRLAAYLFLRMFPEEKNLQESDKRKIYRSLLFDMAEPLKIGMSEFLDDHKQWGYNRIGDPFNFDYEDSSVGYKIVPTMRQLDLSIGHLELEDLWVPFQDFNKVLSPFFDYSKKLDKTGTIYAPIENTLSEVGLSINDVDMVLLNGGMCELPLIEIGLMNYFPESVRVVKTPSTLTSVAQGAALYHASRFDREINIEVEEPALFESVFLEKKEKFLDLIVDKKCKAHSSGTYPISFEQGAEKIRISLYHGFNENDPSVVHDRDLLIQLDDNFQEINEVELRWEVNHDRTVTFSWRLPNSENGWRDMVEASRAKGGDWYPEDLKQAEREKIRLAEFE
jgi:molecular chaperone DnaK